MSRIFGTSHMVYCEFRIPGHPRVRRLFYPVDLLYYNPFPEPDVALEGDCMWLGNEDRKENQMGEMKNL